LFSNGNVKNTFHINVIIPDTVKQSERDLIKRVCDYFDNCCLNFIVFTNELTDIVSTVDHLTNVTYYRLLLHTKILDFDKCIWLDSDTIVCSDICELYNYDIGDNYIAGVPAPGFHLHPKYHCERLEISTLMGYVNAGVLLMNFRKLREDKLEEVFLKLSYNRYEVVDQDVLNVACYGKISLLDFRFNFQPSRVFEANEYITNVFPINEIAQAYKSPTVVHFLDAIKPWQDENYDFGNYWIDYYIELSEVIPEIKGFYSERKEKEQLDLKLIDSSKKLIFYGAGVRGREMLMFSRFMKLREPDEIWDIDFEKIHEIDGIKVVFPRFNDCKTSLKDVTLVICIDSEQVVKELRELSNTVGITNIFTASYLKKGIWENWLTSYTA